MPDFKSGCKSEYCVPFSEAQAYLVSATPRLTAAAPATRAGGTRSGLCGTAVRQYSDMPVHWYGSMAIQQYKWVQYGAMWRRKDGPHVTDSSTIQQCTCRAACALVKSHLTHHVHVGFQQYKGIVGHRVPGAQLQQMAQQRRQQCQHACEVHVHMPVECSSAWLQGAKHEHESNHRLT